jgi:hypothetical protein
MGGAATAGCRSRCPVGRSAPRLRTRHHSTARTQRGRSRRRCSRPGHGLAEEVGSQRSKRTTGTNADISVGGHIRVGRRRLRHRAEIGHHDVVGNSAPSIGWPTPIPRAHTAQSSCPVEIPQFGALHTAALANNVKHIAMRRLEERRGGRCHSQVAADGPQGIRTLPTRAGCRRGSGHRRAGSATNSGRAA